MKKYPVLIQDEQSACGVFCIAMILQYYGYKEELKEIKKRTRMNHTGITIYGMIECFKSYHSEAKAYEVSLKTLHKEFDKPCILLMNNDGIGHYVVLYEIKDHEYIIGDPAVGLVKLKEEEMSHYTSRCIMITHVGHVTVGKKETLIKYFKNILFTYHQSIKSIIYKGIIISILGYISSFFFQWIIDYIQYQSSLFIVLSIVLAYILCELIKDLFNYIKTKQLVKLQYYLDEDLVSDSLYRYIHHYDDKKEDLGMIQSEFLSLFQLSEMSVILFENIFIDMISIIVFSIGMLLINHYLYICIFLLFISLIISTYILIKPLRQYQKDYIDSTYQYSAYLLKLLSSIRYLSMHHLNKQYKHTYQSYFSSLMKNKITKEHYSNRLYLINNIIIHLFYFIILCISFYMYSKNNISLGNIFMFYMLLTYCISPVMKNIIFFIQYQDMQVLYEKYKKYYNDVIEKEYILKDQIKSISFDHIAYSYGYSIPILEHLDWYIDCSIILSGESGSGKSTLLKLLLGYNEDYSGDIYINDINLKTINQSSLFHHISYLDETPVFIEGTLLENLLCDDIKKIIEMFKIFELDDLLPLLEVHISIEGMPLSLGQRQMMALIRELLSEKDVYIFDEAFSHVDSHMYHLIYDYLQKTKDQYLYIIVDHQINLMNINFDCAIMSGKRIVKDDENGNRF